MQWPTYEHNGAINAFEVARIIAQHGGVPPGMPGNQVEVLAAILMLSEVDSRARKAIQAALAAQLPAASGLKKLPPGKAIAAAEALELPRERFCEAMLALATGRALPHVLKALPLERAFAAMPEVRLLEYRLTTKSLPPGLSNMRELRTLAILSPRKLQTSANAAELARLPRPITLQLDFDGMSDGVMGEIPVFQLPDLSLLADADAGGLTFASTGALVHTSAAALSPLSSWARLVHLDLRKSTLKNPTLDDLSWLRTTTPRLTRLDVEWAPPGWRDVWPNVDLRVGLDAIPAE